MKTARKNIDGFLNIGELLTVLMFRIGSLNPLALIAGGVVLLALVTVLFLTGGPSQEDNEESL